MALMPGILWFPNQEVSPVVLNCTRHEIHQPADFAVGYGPCYREQLDVGLRHRLKDSPRGTQCRRSSGHHIVHENDGARAYR